VRLAGRCLRSGNAGRSPRAQGQREVDQKSFKRMPFKQP
jgi:hypothetical protein